VHIVECDQQTPMKVNAVVMGTIIAAEEISDRRLL
jgi:hypothetical protein